MFESPQYLNSGSSNSTVPWGKLFITSRLKLKTGSYKLGIRVVMGIELINVEFF